MSLGQKSTDDVAAREDAGTTIHLRDAANAKMYQADEKTPITALVAGSYSSRYRRAQEANRDKAVKRRAPLDGDQLDEQARELLAACIISWDGVADDDGQPIPFSKKNAVDLLARAPWIREQIENAVFDHAAFFRQPSAS